MTEFMIASSHIPQNSTFSCPVTSNFTQCCRNRTTNECSHSQTSSAVFTLGLKMKSWDAVSIHIYLEAVPVFQICPFCDA